MKDVRENELLSAYLDGELTAGEQADVERLLAQSAAARQLVDEFRALSATLQSLPARKLHEDLSEPVLRIAERRMLAGRSEPEKETGPHAADATGEPPAWRAILRRALRPRNLLWPAAAVAAAVLIMVMNPSQRGERDAGKTRVAMAPDDAPADTEPATIGHPADVREEELAERLKAEGILAEGSGRDEARASRARLAIAGKAAAPAPVAPVAGEPTAAGGEKRLDSDSGSVAGMARRGSSGAVMRMMAKPSAPEAPGASPPSAAISGPAKAPADKAGEVAGRDFKWGNNKEGRGEDSGLMQGAMPVIGKASGEPFVVLCELTPEAVRQRAFEQIVSVSEVRDPAKSGKAAGEDYVEVQLTQPQLDDVLTKLKAQPQFFAAVIPGAPMPDGYDLRDNAKPLIGKGGGPAKGIPQAEAQQSLDVDSQQTLDAKAGRSMPGVQAPGPAQRAVQGRTPGAASGYGMRGAPLPGGRGGGVAGSAESKPEIRPRATEPQTASQAASQVQVQRGKRGGQPASGMGAPKGAGASLMKADARQQLEPVLPGKANAPQTDSPHQLPAAQPGAPGVMGALGGAKGFGAANGQMMRAVPVPAETPGPGQLGQFKTPTPAGPQPGLHYAPAQELDEGVAKRRVLFVLRVVADGSRGVATAKKDLAGDAAKTEKSKAAAEAQAPASTTPAKQPAGAAGPASK